MLPALWSGTLPAVKPSATVAISLDAAMSTHLHPTCQKEQLEKMSMSTKASAKPFWVGPFEGLGDEEESIFMPLLRAAGINRKAHPLG